MGNRRQQPARGWGRAQAGATGLAMAAAITLASCTTVPEPQLRSYAETVTLAQTASLEIYAALRPAFDLAKDAAPPATPPTAAPGRAEGAISYAATLGPGWEGALSGCRRLAGYVDLEARCRAFEFATRYNQLLVDIKTGEAGGVVGPAGRIGRLAGLVAPMKAAMGELQPIATMLGAAMPLSPLAGFGFSAIEELLAAAQELETDAEVAGLMREGLPIVEDLVAKLRADAPLIHRIQQRYYDYRLDLVVTDAAAPGAPPSPGLTNRFSLAWVVFRRTLPPQDETSADFAQFEQLRARYDAALRRIEENPDLARATAPTRQTRPEETKTFPYAATMWEGVNGAIRPVELSLAEFQALSDAWRRYHESLTTYDGMLANILVAMDELKNASERSILPPALQGLSLLSFLDANDIDVTKIMTIAVDVQRRAQRITDLLAPTAPVLLGPSETALNP